MIVTELEKKFLDEVFGPEETEDAIVAPYDKLHDYYQNIMWLKGHLQILEEKL